MCSYTWLLASDHAPYACLHDCVHGIADEYWKLVLEQHSPEEIMEELEKMDGEGLLPEGTETLPMRVAARPGCTPFEFVKFTDETIEHEVALTVRP